MSRRTLRLAGLTTLAALAAGAAVAAAVGVGGTGTEAATGTGLPAATTTVTRATLVEHTEVDGTLGYGAVTALEGRGGGTITWLPGLGAVVERGGTLYRVDELPVTLLYGNLPAYRRLAAGDKGADVRQLEENLAALGYTGFTVDDAYTSATAAAVQRWQRDLGRAETGVVEPGQIAYAAGAVRVSKLDAQLGGQAGGPVLHYTGTTRSVRVDLDVDDQALAVVGGTVKVTLPGGRTVTGTVSSVGTVATAASDGGPGQNSAGATIEVTVTIEDQAALGALDEAPVDVALVSQERKNVLTVPVTALLALREGGYGLEVVDGAVSRIVAVEVGMFADGRVEVSGAGVAEGTTVGVAK
ncbi:MAG TPA: peptidoglycan-binding protein [Pseudonocardiaceae bacterium]|jgi:peptidoglycan hydrolase-like protein with peptidoglycan-binding domain